MNEIQVNYYISADANIRKSFEFDSARNSIGNSFPTSEEAKKAVEKLKAFKRLKDNGFKFTGCYDDNTIDFAVNDLSSQTEEDLGLLFGGEE